METMRRCAQEQEKQQGKTVPSMGDKSSIGLDSLLLACTGSYLQQQPSQKHLELHRRVLDLAGRRAKVMGEVEKVEAWKSAMCQQKLTQQAALMSKLNVRLHGLLGEADRQAVQLEEHVRDIDEYCTKCARILQGIECDPEERVWASLEDAFNRLMSTSVCPELVNDWLWMEKAFVNAEQQHKQERGIATERMQELENELHAARQEISDLSGQINDCRVVSAEMVRERDDLQASLDQVLCSASEREEQLSMQRTKYKTAVDQLERRHQEEIERLEAMLRGQLCPAGEESKISTPDLV